MSSKITKEDVKKLTKNLYSIKKRLGFGENFEIKELYYNTIENNLTYRKNYKSIYLDPKNTNYYITRYLENKIDLVDCRENIYAELNIVLYQTLQEENNNHKKLGYKKKFYYQIVTLIKESIENLGTLSDKEILLDDEIQLKKLITENGYEIESKKVYISLLLYIEQLGKTDYSNTEKINQGNSLLELLKTEMKDWNVKSEK